MFIVDLVDLREIPIFWVFWHIFEAIFEALLGRFLDHYLNILVTFENCFNSGSFRIEVSKSCFKAFLHLMFFEVGPLKPQRLQSWVWYTYATFEIEVKLLGLSAAKKVIKTHLFSFSKGPILYNSFFKYFKNEKRSHACQIHFGSHGHFKRLTKKSFDSIFFQLHFHKKFIYQTFIRRQFKNISCKHR